MGFLARAVLEVAGFVAGLALLVLGIGLLHLLFGTPPPAWSGDALAAVGTAAAGAGFLVFFEWKRGSGRSHRAADRWVVFLALGATALCVAYLAIVVAVP